MRTSTRMTMLPLELKPFPNYLLHAKQYIEDQKTHIDSVLQQRLKSIEYDKILSIVDESISNLSLICIIIDSSEVKTLFVS
jgi:hypothetical protein